MEWDDNNFKTNQFAHPFQGSLYFSAFRSNGYDFWQSAPAAMAGSLMWEIAGETHNPAPNDFINTSLGGIALGEMSYRLSNQIVHDNHGGFGRQMEEVCAFIINPMNGFNRIINGKWGRIKVGAHEAPPIHIGGTLDMGVRRFSDRTENVFSKGTNEFYLRLKLQYGDPFAIAKKPFSNFFVIIEAGESDSGHLNVLQVNGALKEWVISKTGGNLHMGAITMNYDYFHNNAFEYGGQSFNFNVLSSWRRDRKARIETNFGAGLIVLAAVPDDYLYYGEGRNYDYGPGLSWLAGTRLTIRDKLIFSVNYRAGLFITLNGNESWFFLNNFSGEARYYFLKNFSISMELGRFNLHGHYKNYDNVDKQYPFARLAVGVRL